MADSDLYKMGRILNLEAFNTRVKAALLQQASTMTLSGTRDEPKNFAIWVLKHPMEAEPSMAALVAADPAVLSAITITEDVASADGVTDAQIKSVVTARWSLVASKYPVSTLQ